ncbi:PREDICTED: protein TPX2-like isoform X2 [Tarenaya hassleriana]|uniref:protein TPX2-like isoform X2 n=1 Tax=Tarenaya hassleriana TaxID=28532 RepID=UPI00053C0D85|nr:PREDICTED: protein TPX2-like isoform X2 [Tarenaya hassleriana]
MIVGESEGERAMGVFEVREIDLDYEFDAVRWYDFSAEESPEEVLVAELWFETAQSYPPSPFVTKLLLRDHVSDGKTELSTRPEDGEATSDICDTDREVGKLSDYLAKDVNKTGTGIRSGICASSQGGSLNEVPSQPLYKGPTFSNHVHAHKPKCGTKSSVQLTSRRSTLMKPTASQLAKQNHYRLEIQATKRQKLEGGLLCKIADMKEEMNFVHKTPKNGATLDRNLQRTRTKITAPQQLERATTQWAQRIRPMNDVKTEPDSTAVYRFKARPFNRKIFVAPSLPIRMKSTPQLPEFHEFHLRTSERAMQHSSAVTTTSYQCIDSDMGSENHNTTTVLDGVNEETRRPSTMDIAKHDVSNINHVTKARPLNKKILSSRDDVGVFRNNKTETTLPLKFGVHEEKRVQQDLPTYLFSKLSIISELQPDNGSRSKFPQPPSGLMKENRLNSFQSKHGMRFNEVTAVSFLKPTSSRTVGVT